VVRGLTAAELGPVFRDGARVTVDDLRHRWPGHAIGAVRVSVGIATTPADVAALVQLLREFTAE
jgi:selenocysteine lyase/cysteine desulfurase